MCTSMSLRSRTAKGKNNKITPIHNYFHLCDFVYLLHYLGHELTEHRNPADPTVLVHALQHNFGGIHKVLFKAVVTIFAEEISAEQEQWVCDCG